MVRTDVLRVCSFTLKQWEYCQLYNGKTVSWHAESSFLHLDLFLEEGENLCRLFQVLHSIIGMNQHACLIT